jgi:predicted DNA-binding transcriptional regulator AlpA
MKEFRMSLNMKQGADCRLLYSREHLPRLGINLSPSSLLRLEAAGKFPKRVRIGAHSIAWLASEIHAHVDALAASREDA